MVRKLEIEELRTHIDSLDDILNSRTAEEDPVGHFQLTKRLEELRADLAQVEQIPELRGSVAIYFGGRPVVGSRGIKAEFASEVLDIFQDLVAKQFANFEVGEIGNRGPVPLRSGSELLLTDIARGSVGFILEEAEQQDTIVETQLHIALESVTEAITQTAQVDGEEFDDLLERIDHRYLQALSEFFLSLDDAEATVRLVEGERDVFLDRSAIHRGRERTGAADLAEREDDQMAGRLFLLPGHRKFELVPVDGGTAVIYGTVGATFSQQHLEDLRRADDIVGRRWRARVRIRVVNRPNRPPKTTYTLLGLLERLD